MTGLTRKDKVQSDSRESIRSVLVDLRMRSEPTVAEGTSVGIAT